MTTATLTWSLPTTRIDGTPLAHTDIASVAIFDGAEQIGTVSGAGTTFTTGALSVGDHSFAVQIADTSGHLSAMSNAAAITVAAVLANPSAVTDLAVTLNP